MKSFSIIFRSAFIVSFLLSLAIFPLSNAIASSIGPFDPGLGSNITGIGTEAWQTPEEITSPGSPYATVSLDRDLRYTNYLQATDYSLNVPSNATITGIEVAINRMSSGSSPSIYDNVVSLVKASVIPGESVVVGNNYASLVQWTKNSFTLATYGGPTDLWGTTWTPAEVNDPGFGVVLAAYRQNMGNNLREAIVDSMQITVYFSFVTATTSVDCGSGTPEVVYGDSITCKATVSDSGYLTPTGTVSWTSDGSGSFDVTSCSLTEVSLGVADCEVVYTPTQAGETLITADYGGDGNYDPGSGNQTVTVDKKLASVTPDYASKTYGETDPTLTGTLEGFLSADNVTATYTRTVGESVSGSPYTISASLSPAAVLGNYEITYNTASFTITKRPITVTADAQTKVVGQPDPLLTYQVTSGSRAFDDEFSGALIRVPGELVGTYAIQQGTLALSSDYLLTYYGADLTITRQIIYFVQIFR